MSGGATDDTRRAGGAGDAGGTGDARGGVTYRERLSPPWWWWPLAFGIGALGAAEIRVASVEALAWLPFAVILPVVAAVLLWVGRSRVVVTGGELVAGGARLDLRLVVDVEALDRAGLRLVLGPRADPSAVVAIRPWVHQGVVLALDPDADPRAGGTDGAPYWVVGTRRPKALAAAVERARS